MDGDRTLRGNLEKGLVAVEQAQLLAVAQLPAQIVCRFPGSARAGQKPDTAPPLERQRMEHEPPERKQRVGNARTKLHHFRVGCTALRIPRGRAHQLVR